MTEDYFWGVTLSSTNKEVKWEPDALKENGGVADISLTAKGEHTLCIKQAVLGADAEENEVNVIEVETTGFKSAVIQQPIVVLTGGKQTQLLLDLNFPDPPVTLKLIKGKGPVHISGNHIVGTEQYNDDDEDDEDDDLDDFEEQGIEDEDEEEEVEDEKKKDDKGTAKKRSNSNSAQSQAKKKKKGKDD